MSERVQPLRCEWCRHRRETLELPTTDRDATHVALLVCIRGHQRLLSLCATCANKARDYRESETPFVCSGCSAQGHEHERINVPGLRWPFDYSPQAVIAIVDTARAWAQFGRLDVAHSR